MEIIRTTKIKSLNHEDLVDLFSTSLYGSSFLGVDYDSEFHKNIPDDKKEGDCLEDRLADVLLNGGKIRIVDLYSEGEAYGNLPYHFIDGDYEKIDDPDSDELYGCAYEVGLNDIIEGIERACNSDNGYERDCADSYINEDSRYDFDLEYAETLMQVIIFGEQIYG